MIIFRSVRNVSDKFVEKIKTYIIMFINVFFNKV